MEDYYGSLSGEEESLMISSERYSVEVRMVKASLSRRKKGFDVAIKVYT